MIARPRSITRVLALVLVVALAPRPARAQDSEAVARARARFEAGRALYVLGDYETALREFMIGYQLVQKPEFLINLGQCYVKLRQPDKAREMYERFLLTAPKSDPNRPGVEQLVRELDATSPRPSPVEPVPSPSPAPPSPEPSPSPSQRSSLVPPAPTPAIVAAAPAKKRFDRRHLAWIVPLAAVVVAGVAVGIYFGARPSDGCISGLPCVDSSHGR